MSELLSTRETGALLGTPEETLRYWRHIGRGPECFKLRRRVVYERSAVEAWVAAQRASTLRGDAA